MVLVFLWDLKKWNLVNAGQLFVSQVVLQKKDLMAAVNNSLNHKKWWILSGIKDEEKNEEKKREII